MLNQISFTSFTLFQFYCLLSILSYIFDRYVNSRQHNKIKNADYNLYESILKQTSQTDSTDQDARGSFEKSKRYHNDIYLIQEILTPLVLLFSLMFAYHEGSERMQSIVSRYTDHPGLIVAGASILKDLLSLFTFGIWFQIYITFVIENKYGFNTTTPSLFIKDTLKSLMLSIVLSCLIYSLLFYSLSVLQHTLISLC